MPFHVVDVTLVVEAPQGGFGAGELLLGGRAEGVTVDDQPSRGPADDRRRNPSARSDLLQGHRIAVVVGRETDVGIPLAGIGMPPVNHTPSVVRMKPSVT